MKLPDFHNFEPLNRVKAKMGIPQDAYGNPTVLVCNTILTDDESKKLASPAGIEIPIGDVQVLSDCTLAYKNSRVLLYIPDATRFEPRFHVSNCRTLQEMRRQNRFETYVVSSVTNGLFQVFRNGNLKPTNQPLSVCQNCLLLLSYNGFQGNMTVVQKRRMVEFFDLQKFFKMYPQTLHITLPAHTSATAPRNVYPSGFEEISRREREAAGWICQRCELDLSVAHFRRFLHVHHKNGLKYENSKSNLEVLCIACHADEPRHAHMKQFPGYLEFLQTKLSRSS